MHLEEKPKCPGVQPRKLMEAFRGSKGVVLRCWTSQERRDHRIALGRPQRSHMRRSPKAPRGDRF